MFFFCDALIAQGLVDDEYGIASIGGGFIQSSNWFAWISATLCSSLLRANERTGVTKFLSFRRVKCCWFLYTLPPARILKRCLHVINFITDSFGACFLFWMTGATGGNCRGEAGSRAAGRSRTEEAGHFHWWTIQCLIQMLCGAVAVVLRKDACGEFMKLMIKFKHIFVSRWKVTSEVCVLFLENEWTRCVAVAIGWIYREETHDGSSPGVVPHMEHSIYQASCLLSSVERRGSVVSNPAPPPPPPPEVTA